MTLIVILIIIALVWYFFVNGSDEKPSKKSPQENYIRKNEDGMSRGDIMDAIDNGSIFKTIKSLIDSGDYHKAKLTALNIYNVASDIRGEEETCRKLKVLMAKAEIADKTSMFPKDKLCIKYNMYSCMDDTMKQMWDGHTIPLANIKLNKGVFPPCEECTSEVPYGCELDVRLKNDES